VPASRIVLFEERDVRPDSAQLCGTGELSQMSSRLHPFEQKSNKDGLGVVTPALTYRRIDLATEADWEYYSIYGTNANAQIQGVINQIDGIYKNQLSITLRIVFQSVYTANTDPYTATDSLALLTQFRNHWNANRGGVARDAAHLFTGRDMDGNTIGRAWLGVVCNNPGNSYGVSQDYWNMVTLVAHEIGHNFGASHDDQVSPPADACTGSGTIMCSIIQSGSTTFSYRSRSDIGNHVRGNGGCLEWVSLPPYEPNAHFLWTHSGPTVYFDASSSYDSDGYITNYFWDFGDGGPGGSGVSPTYTYPVEGCYTVTLTVLDNQGLIHSYSTVVPGTWREEHCI
ncbi:MAG TPA: M12 family metallo-peptidase, partial [Thermoanaerobaculia bacterium]